MIGSRIGSYEILSLLGRGGMGEVYRARDTTLGRDVAVKVLPSDVAADPERMSRFAREARLLAALNHPHVATIHGFEHAAGVSALVMELVEGPTLLERIADGGRGRARGMALAEALRLASQIAEALEAAHYRGVIHRDLKPANIKLGPGDSVKVLDFGLAKALSSEAAGADRHDLATVSATALHAGVVGTPAYMSPEHARGQEVDKRTDIWAFGCVLFEMLSGRAVFQRETITDTIAAVLEREPEWAMLPQDTPAAVRRLLQRCLAKDPRQRLHDIADARLEIADVLAAPPQSAVASARTRPPLFVPLSVAAIVLALVAISTAIWTRRRGPPAPSAAWLEINTAPTKDPAVAISPDGSKIVFVASSEGHSQLWLRSLDSAAARPLRGTERGTRPFWSPNSRSIGFFAAGRLKKMDIDGGSATTLTASSAVPLGGAWSRHGVILFADNPGGPISRMPEGGGQAEDATRLEMPAQRGHWYPDFLPDGRHFVFFVDGTADAGGIYVGQLDSLESRRLFGSDGPAAYSASGYLFFTRDGALLAQGFDAERLELQGDPVTIAAPLSRRAVPSVSIAGSIVYRMPPPDEGQRQFQWIDRSGKELQKLVYEDGAALGPALSHDGHRLAIYHFKAGNMDIWTYEPRRKAWDRVTFDPGDDIYPLWSPDDASIIYAGLRQDGILNLYRKPVTGPPGSEELVASSAFGKFPTDWSADGRYLLYDSLRPNHGPDIHAVTLDGSRQPIKVVETDFREGFGQFSPDGRWIAYQSDRTGRFEIYVRPFPGGGDDTRISTDGGSQPRWNSNGNELFYVADDDRLMAVPVSFSPDAKAPVAGTATALFATNIGSAVYLLYRQQYVVARDGKSFVMNSVAGSSTASPITVILNWKPGR